MTEAERLIGSIAYCGLICKLCFLADECDGCKTQNNRCDRNCSDAGCFQKQCCETKNLAGCWECDDIYACEEGIYAQGGYSKVKAFAICMKEDGVDSFIRNILRNMEKGWSLEKGKDYDGKPIAQVLAMIRG